MSLIISPHAPAAARGCGGRGPALRTNNLSGVTLIPQDTEIFNKTDSGIGLQRVRRQNLEVCLLLDESDTPCYGNLVLV